MNTKSTSARARHAGARCATITRFAGAIALIVLRLADAAALEPVRAELDKTSAWTGEAVTLTITLFSPGPFSGTATFDLPELAQTVFVKTGNPIVGSQQIDGESYLTQRHEFKVYTQQVGEVVISTFRVRFSGKETFTSDPRPIEARTPELRFQSKRPPAAGAATGVTSARSMTVRQTWNPLPEHEVEPGDVIIRTVTREAEGTTAMLLPPILADAPTGVEVYVGKQEVQDVVERGDQSAQRTDTIKYQFQQPGRFTLPELTIQWWDPKREQLMSESASGLTVEVATPTATTLTEKEAQSSIRWQAMAAAFLTIGALWWLVYQPLSRWLAAWKTYRNRPTAVAASKLQTACATNNAAEAYAALMAWLTAQRALVDTESVQQLIDGQQALALQEPWQALSRYLFSSEQPKNPWSGNQLWEAFTQAQRQLSQQSPDTSEPVLPDLNP